MRRLGGTDVGPVVALYRPELAPDLAKYANASDVWMRLVHNIERPRTTVMSRGLDAEPRLRRAYLDAFPCELATHEQPWIVAHPSRPWATCSPDDVAFASVATLSERWLVEYKSTSVFARHKWGDAETDAVPDLYQLQVQWCLEILDLPRAHLFVGFGRDFKDEHGAQQFLYEETRLYRIERDRELAAMCLDFCGRFHSEFVEGRKPPPLAPVHNKRAFSRLLKGETQWTETVTS